MIQGIYKVTQGMVYESLRLDVIANNLANVDSTGYKKSRLQVTSSSDTHFNDYMRKSLETEPSESPYETPELIRAHYNIDFEEGQIQETRGRLDVAIFGEGFFGIQLTDGSTAYTRDGTFKLGPDGTLVNQLNLQVLDPRGAPIQLPLDTKQLEILSTGQILADGVEAASLMVVNFQEPYPLSKIGGNLFELNDPNLQPTPVDFQADNVQLMQGFLETSNVNTIHEMVQMIETLRNYEGYQKVLQSFEETAQQLNDAARV